MSLVSSSQSQYSLWMLLKCTFFNGNRMRPMTDPPPTLPSHVHAVLNLRRTNLFFDREHIVVSAENVM